MAQPVVLVVDDDVGMVETLVDILSANGYDVAGAHSGGAAITMVTESHYDVALMDIQMPGVNGVEALKTIRTVAPHLTVIMMTAFTSDELVEEARRASAVEILAKPFDIARVLDSDQQQRAAGRDAGRPRVTGRGGVLIVDDDPGICETLSDVLEERGYHVRVFQRARAALEQLVSAPTDAAILDIMLPDMSGLDVLQAIKTASPATEVIVITGHASLPTAIRAIDGSAFAYLVKPVEVEHLLSVLRRAIERGQLTRALRESNQTLEAVVEAAPLAIWVANADGTVRMWNPAAERIFGWRRDEVIGRPPPVVALDDGAESRALLERPLRGEALVAVELQRQRKDGAPVELERVDGAAAGRQRGHHRGGGAGGGHHAAQAARSSSCGRRRSWRPSGGSPAGSRTTSTTC